MKLIPIEEVPAPGVMRAYRDRSWIGPLIAMVIMLGVLFFIAITRNGPAAFILIAFPFTLVLILGLFIALRARHYWHADNWLLLETEDALYVNLRSPLNRLLPRPHPTVLQIPRSEVAAVCRTQETRILPGHGGGSKDVFGYIDIYLNHGDTAAVAEVLRAERRLTPERGGKHHDYRVRIIEPAGVRLMWEWIKPAESRALKLLGERHAVAPDQKVRYREWAKLNDEEREAVIGELWEQGELLNAVKLVRYHRNCTLTKAKAWVEERFGAG